MPEDALEGWITTEEAKAVTGLSRTTLYFYGKLGYIQTRKVAATVLFSRADCERVAANRAQGLPPTGKE